MAQLTWSSRLDFVSDPTDSEHKFRKTSTNLHRLLCTTSIVNQRFVVRPPKYSSFKGISLKPRKLPTTLCFARLYSSRQKSQVFFCKRHTCNETDWVSGGNQSDVSNGTNNVNHPPPRNNLRFRAPSIMKQFFRDSNAFQRNSWSYTLPTKLECALFTRAVQRSQASRNVAQHLRSTSEGAGCQSSKHSADKMSLYSLCDFYWTHVIVRSLEEVSRWLTVKHL